MVIFSSGADWYTATNVLQDDQARRSLMSVFLGLSEVNTKWAAGGYKGKQDIGGKLKFGSRLRKDGQADEILVSSAEQADKTIGYIGDVAPYKATRLDLQVTIQLDVPDSQLSSDMYGQLSAMNGAGNSPTGRRKVSHVRSDTGDTLYVGARRSGRKFFRFYDKGNDLGAERGRFWRAEVQYGRDLANDAIAVYSAIRHKPQSVIDLVSAEFYDATGFRVIPESNQDTEVVSTNPPEMKSVASKLDWLRVCVRPTIALLIEEELEGDMMEALGLKPPGNWGKM